MEIPFISKKWLLSSGYQIMATMVPKQHNARKFVQLIRGY